MNVAFRVLAGLALAMPAGTMALVEAAPTPKALAAKSSAKSKSKTKTAAVRPKAAPVVEAAPAITPSVDAGRVAAWVAASGDNHALPYAIIDKAGGALFLFDGQGKPLDAVPVLVGIAAGDDATPGVGSKKLAEIGPAEKTTPAGRFLAKFGVPFRKERVLWVDYATSVALHPIPGDAGQRERRRDRMLSPTPEDNRITFGCINVPKAFYANLLRPRFQKKGGYVYVLPDTKPLEEVFPRVRVQELINAGSAPQPLEGV